MKHVKSVPVATERRKVDLRGRCSRFADFICDYLDFGPSGRTTEELESGPGIQRVSRFLFPVSDLHRSQRPFCRLFAIAASCLQPHSLLLSGCPRAPTGGRTRLIIVPEQAPSEKFRSVGLDRCKLSQHGLLVPFW